MKIVIFGCSDTAQLAKYYIDRAARTRNHVFGKQNSPWIPREVAAFTVHKKYLKEDISVFEGCPLVPFEYIEKLFPPDEYLFFAPMMGSKMNQNRQDVYEEAKKKGYKFYSYVSPDATVLNEFDIGENCFILENNTIQPFVKIGNNVVLWSGNHIGHHSEIKDHVFFTSHVVMSGHCIIGENSWLGVNAALRDGLRIAKSTLVAMASCIVKDTEENSLYMGVPAKKIEGKTALEANP